MASQICKTLAKVKFCLVIISFADKCNIESDPVLNYVKQCSVIILVYYNVSKFLTVNSTALSGKRGKRKRTTVLYVTETVHSAAGT